MKPSSHLDRFLNFDKMRVLVEISQLKSDGYVPYAGEVADRLDLDPSFLSKLLDSYEEAGLVSRGEKLGNLKVLELTDEGSVVSEWMRDLLVWAEYEGGFDEVKSED